MHVNENCKIGLAKTKLNFNILNSLPGVYNFKNYSLHPPPTEKGGGEIRHQKASFFILFPQNDR